MHDASYPSIRDTRLLRSARSQWLAALASVLAALGVLSIPVAPSAGEGNAQSPAARR